MVIVVVENQIIWIWDLNQNYWNQNYNYISKLQTDYWSKFQTKVQCKSSSKLKSK